jgi:hypothetical protein
MKRTVVCLLLLFLMAAPVHAQLPTGEYEEAHGAMMALGGLAVGTVGFLAGFKIGVDSSTDTGMFAGFDDGFEWGSAVGAVTLGLGVHLANSGRGDIGPVVLSSMLIGGAGVGLAYATDTPEIVIPTVFFQLFAAVVAEQKSARGNYEESLTRVGLWRPGDGGTGLAVQMTF